MDRNKKIIVTLIFAITSVLAGLSVYVSWQLRREVSPDDFAADVGTTPTVFPSMIEPTKTDKKKTPTKVPTKTPTKIPTPVPSSVQPTQPAGGDGGGTQATPVPSGPLPQTALIDNRTDAAIMGSVLILMGIVLYKKYLNFGDKKSIR